ncbi:MAG: DUF1987 domain-containing protein [Bacteroidales bacterium]|nr:DUF1987 domain-containing protein [Bacteroidales bacterium]
MKDLIIEAQPDAPYYPEVNFNADNGVLEILGESYMEEAYKFFLPLIDWIKEYTLELRKPITMNFKLTYFNTSSSRLILDMLDLFKSYQQTQGDVTINWYFDPEDPDMKDEIEDFEIESGVSINLIPME